MVLGVSDNVLSIPSLNFLYRIGELFEIIVDFPDSKPALMDLKLCLQIADVEDGLISCLKERCMLLVF